MSGGMEMPAIDLKPFCGENDIRYYLNEPFSEGEFTYATNGHILIRVARRGDAAEVDDKSVMKGKCEKLFSENPFVADSPIPDIPPMVEADCHCCNGDGDHQYKCSGAPPYECGECAGTGKQMDEPGDLPFPHVEIGGIHFAPRYLRLIKALPNYRFSPVETKPSPFKFDGGDGLLMPMRKEDHK